MDVQGDQNEDETKGDVAVMEERPSVDDPGKYAVILHNDDYTTMEFVIEVLEKYFQKSKEEAYQVMMKVHKAGNGIAGIYSHDIAETKVIQVIDYARANGHPLKASIEKVGEQ